MDRTKIVATIGPASDDNETLEALEDAGIDVARQNFSHGTHDEHKTILEHVKTLDTVASMADTQGPEVRLTDLPEPITVNEGDVLTLSDDTDDDADIHVDYDEFSKHITEDDRILIDDGTIELDIETIDTTIRCRVVYGGTIRSRKSVNVPGKDLGLRPPTDKDQEDVAFAAKAGFDFISLSFVKEADDIRRVREIVDEHDQSIDIIAKIEHKKAIDNFDAILDEADGIMVARGDLGVETPPEKVPLLQKDLIRKANRAGKPVIVATQMLSSMTQNPTATRAEASDIANAVLDGTDAVMLSEETAVGDYPVESVTFMHKVIDAVESDVLDKIHHTVKEESTSITDTICKSIWQASRDIDADYIITHTSSGTTARTIAKYRSSTPIIAFTDSERVKNQLQLVWGVEPRLTGFPDTVETMVSESITSLRDEGLIEQGDRIVISSGRQTAVPGTTQRMEIRTI